MSDGYILIDAVTRKPVPLPYHTQNFRGDLLTVENFYHLPSASTGRIVTRIGDFYPSTCGLEIISEADFMAEQSDG